MPAGTRLKGDTLKLEVYGFPTLITIILFLGGIQLLSIGIFGNVWGVFLMKRRVAPLILLEKRN